MAERVLMSWGPDHTLRVLPFMPNLTLSNNLHIYDINCSVTSQCRINHRLKQDQIDVLAVIHGAQLLFEEIK